MSTLNETILYVDLKKLEENFIFLKNKLNANTKIIGVVKAFAYGHGDISISKKLEDLGFNALWVSDFEEGVSLRKAGVKTNIIVANPGFKSYDVIIKYQLDVVIYNQRLLDLYCLKNNKINIHLKFNTGMNRYGFDYGELKLIVAKIQKNPHLNVLSICSHLAASYDRSKKEHTLKQINKFKLICKDLQRLINKKIDRHVLNSNGLLNFPEHQMECVRLGIGLYGLTKINRLKQISSLYSVITQIRNLKKGDSVGYGKSYISSNDMKIAIIPLGYADGLNRNLGNNTGSVVVNNIKCNIIGEISMDSFAVDITGVSAKEGDSVEIFGDKIPVAEVAKNLNTISYEIFSTLNRRIKRVYSNS